MTCEHHAPDRWEAHTYAHPWTGEPVTETVRVSGEWWLDESEIGRWRCTRCGHVGYYTGQWKRFYEEGVPCADSEGVQR